MWSRWILHRRLVIGLCFVLANTDSDFQALLEAGQSLYRAGRFPEAAGTFQRAVQLHPTSPSARYWLGMAYYVQKQDPLALEQFQHAVQLDRTSAEGHLGIGLVYLRMKHRRLDAREILREAARLDPTNAQIQYTLGLTYVEQSKGGQALVYRDGRPFFQRAIKLDPHHPDAYYQLALSYEYPAPDYNKAIPLYVQQVVVMPHHREALRHLSQCYAQTGRYRDGVECLTRLAQAHGQDADLLIQTLMAQLNASYFQTQKQSEQALTMYETYLDSLDPDARALYKNLASVASEEEAQRYQQASSAEREELWRKFWAARDPDPTTVVNERLVEHYRRVMYAREHFSQGRYPWDRRGELYIRYGEPDDRQRFRGMADWEANRARTGNSQVDVIRDLNSDDNPLQRYRLRAYGAAVIESWVYVRYGMELFFVDQYGHGVLDYPLPRMGERPPEYFYHPKKLAEDLIRRTPEAYPYDYGGLPLDVVFDIVTYKAPGGQTLVEVTYSVPAHQLGNRGDGQGSYTRFESHVVLRDSEWRRVAAVADTIGPIERPPTGTGLRTAVLSFLAPAGIYRSAVEVRDEASKRIGIFEKALTVSDYSGERLSVSDLKLSTSITPQSTPGPFVRHGLAIMPNPARLFRRAQPVYLYYELYHLGKAAAGRTAYRTSIAVTAKQDGTKEAPRGLGWRILAGFGKLMKQSSNEQSVLLTFDDAGMETDEYKYAAIEMGDAPAGTYTLTLSITDVQTGQTVVKSTELMVVDARASRE